MGWSASEDRQVIDVQRPSAGAEVKALILQMAETNVGWGAPRIHGELLKLGIDIGERSVSRFMPPRPRNPPSQTWRSFLENHVGALASIDFLTVPTATFRVIYVFFVLAHDRRRVLHFNVTEHPSAAWTAQQMIEAFPEDTAPKYLVRDRDGIYGEQSCRRVGGIGIDEVLTAPRSPWQNPYAERLVGSVRRECLDHMIVLGEKHYPGSTPSHRASDFPSATARGSSSFFSSLRSSARSCPARR